jgi:hypothetical protein
LSFLKALLKSVIATTFVKMKNLSVALISARGETISIRLLLVYVKEEGGVEEEEGDDDGASRGGAMVSDVTLIVSTATAGWLTF